jgi:BirA family biotin operon repressor/biotin-[acetyl-CoA-carboxylase] ligase
MLDDLRATAVATTLTTRWLGKDYQFFPSLASTNETLKKESASLPTGAVCVTDFQSQGRGRLQRTWQAPAGTSLLMSMLLRPDWTADQGHWLTMMAGLAVAEAIETTTHLQVGLKWPNDVMIEVGETWRKVCGILVEAEMGEDGRFQHIILGIGLNVNIPADQLPTATATSLLAAGGQPVPRLPLLTDILARLEGYVQTAVSPHAPWQQRLITLGQPVVVRGNGRSPLYGIAESTDHWGRLLVRDEQSHLHTIAAGDVTLRSPI